LKPKKNAIQSSGMNIQMRPIGDIKPYEKNPRLNARAIAAVAESIKTFGWQQPIVIDAAGIIIAGHTRLQAALRLGLAEVPVQVANLTPAAARAYRLADNSVAELSEWDFALLQEEIAAVASSTDLSALNLELDSLLAESAPPSKEFTLRPFKKCQALILADLDQWDRIQAALAPLKKTGIEIHEMLA